MAVRRSMLPFIAQIIVKDTVGAVLRSLLSVSGWYVDDHLLLTALATIVVLPVCFLRRFSSLERFSMVSLVAVLFMIFAVNVRTLRRTMIPLGAVTRKGCS